MKTNFSLLFYLKKPKNYVKGVVPIYLRITVDGKRAELCTSRECEPELWNTSAGHMAGTKEEAKSLNSYLDKMKAGVTIKDHNQNMKRTYMKMGGDNAIPEEAGRKVMRQWLKAVLAERTKYITDNL